MFLISEKDIRGNFTGFNIEIEEGEELLEKIKAIGKNYNEWLVTNLSTQEKFTISEDFTKLIPYNG